MPVDPSPTASTGEQPVSELASQLKLNHQNLAAAIMQIITTVGNEDISAAILRTVAIFTAMSSVPVNNNVILIQPGASSATVASALAVDGMTFFLPGNYTTGAISTSANMFVAGLGLVNITAANGLSGNLWNFTGRNCGFNNLIFNGQVYSVFGDQPALDSLLRLEIPGWSSGAFANSRKVINCSFNGAQTWLSIIGGDNVVIDNLIGYRSYNDGISISTGINGLTLRGLRASQCGIGSAVKFAAGGQTQPYENISYLDDHALDCGRLDPTQANWQEAFDFAAQHMKNVEVGHCSARRCGNGFGEFKLAYDGGGTHPASEAYRDFLVHDNFCELDTDHGIGFALNWVSGSNSTSRNFKLCDNKVLYSGGGTSSSTYGASVTTWDDVEMINLTTDGLFRAVQFSDVGTADKTIRRPYIDGLHVISGTSGVVYSRTAGTLTELELHNSRINVTGLPIDLDAGTGTISSGNKLVSSTTHAASLGTGNYTYETNEISVPDTKRGWIGSGTVLAANNIRGYSAAIPVIAGAVGDVFNNSAPSGGNPKEWDCVTAGDSGVAVWKGLSLDP